MSTIKLKDGTVLNPVNINGDSHCYVQTTMLYQGISRDSLEFQFAKTDYTFEQLDVLFSNPANLATIVIAYPETSADGASSEKQISYNDYSLLTSIGLDKKLVAEATVDTPAIYEDRWTVKVAQLTYLEKTQINQQIVLDDVLIASTL